MPLTAAQLFDFESIFETAIAAALNDAGFPAVRTTATAKQFQEVRPRLELLFQVGSETTPARLLPRSDAVMMSAAFTGKIIVAMITAANPTGKLTHAAYRAQLRAALGLNLLPAINNVNNRLQYHKLQWGRMTGTEYEFSEEQGFEKTAHSYDAFFSLQADAILQFP